MKRNTSYTNGQAEMNWKNEKMPAKNNDYVFMRINYNLL